MLKRSEIVRVTKSWIRVPYLHRGRTRAGVDCYGLIYGIGKELGLDPPELLETPSPGFLLEMAPKFAGPRKSPTNMKPGDLALCLNPDTLIHLAMISEHNGLLTLVHCEQRFGCVVEHRMDSVWRRRVRVVHEAAAEVID